MNIVKQVIDEKVKVALTKNKLKKEWLIWFGHGRYRPRDLAERMIWYL